MHRLAAAAALMLIGARAATAFPLLNSQIQDQVPQGSELAASDVQDLRHQLQLVNGLSMPTGGWTLVPRIDWQEQFTDNVLQAHKPRTFDLASIIAPGIGIGADLPRLNLTFDYAPILSIYARTGDLNSLTQQLNGLGTVTVVPDLAFIDVRALAGVHSLYGGLGGLGSVGAPASATSTAQGAILGFTGNGQGLNKSNEVQTASFGISPYLAHRFGDWGTGRIGYSLDVTSSNALSGFAAPPFPTGGANSQTLITNEEVGHFVTGDFMPFAQNAFDIDLQQGRTTTGTGVVNARAGVPATTEHHSSFTREIFTDRVGYQLTRAIQVFASGGHENISYSGFNTRPIDDLVWSFGTTLTPGPNTQLTVAYGHQNGFNSLTADGHYSLTGRTTLSFSYGSTLGTQLQTIQNQLDLATRNNSGTLVNGQTGGPLFGTTNALAVQDGVFRTTTLTLGTQTVLDRDIIGLNLLLTHQSSASLSNGASAESKVVGADWLHQMRPDMLISASVSYAIQNQTSSTVTSASPGNNTSVAATLAWQWQISDTVKTNLRYSFFDRRSAIAAFDIYQNLLILGVTKSF